jgi:hypothetical protein
MKATLEFELPEESKQLGEALKVGEYKCLLWDLDQWLRGILKYHDDSLSAIEFEAYQRVRSKIHEWSRERGLDLD